MTGTVEDSLTIMRDQLVGRWTGARPDFCFYFCFLLFSSSWQCCCPHSNTHGGAMTHRLSPQRLSRIKKPLVVARFPKARTSSRVDLQSVRGVCSELRETNRNWQRRLAIFGADQNIRRAFCVRVLQRSVVLAYNLMGFKNKNKFIHHNQQKHLTGDVLWPRGTHFQWLDTSSKRLQPAVVFSFFWMIMFLMDWINYHFGLRCSKSNDNGLAKINVTFVKGFTQIYREQIGGWKL